MSRVRISLLFVAVVAGAYAALRLIDCRLVDFGIAAAICAGASVAAGLIAYLHGRRPTIPQRDDEQADDHVDRPCPPSEEIRRTLSGSPQFVDRQAVQQGWRPETPNRRRRPAAGSGANGAR
jgi:hypothetical protein